MRDQHRLRPLQMGIGGHGCAPSLFRPVERNAQPFRQIGPYLVDRRPHVKTEVGRDLLIAAAPAVKLVARVSDQRGQLLFDKVMHVLGFAVVQKRRGRRGLLANLLEALKNGDQFARGQDFGILQRSRVGAAGGQFFPQQPPVEVERPLPALEVGIERLAESS